VAPVAVGVDEPHGQAVHVRQPGRQTDRAREAHDRVVRARLVEQRCTRAGAPGQGDGAREGPATGVDRALAAEAGGEPDGGGADVHRVQGR
jgi:hypothetical protein